MHPKTIISYGWTELKSDNGAVAYKHPHEHKTIVAINKTPFRNYIPLLTPNKKQWNTALVNTKTEEVLFKKEHSTRQKALHTLQDHLKENPVES